MGTTYNTLQALIFNDVMNDVTVKKRPHCLTHVCQTPCLLMLNIPPESNTHSTKHRLGFLNCTAPPTSAAVTHTIYHINQ